MSDREYDPRVTTVSTGDYEPVFCVEKYMKVDEFNKFAEKNIKNEKKIIKNEQKLTKIDEKLQKNVENCENLNSRIDKVYADLNSDYINVIELQKRYYLISTKFTGKVKTKKIKKELLNVSSKRFPNKVGIKDLINGVLNYNVTDINLAYELLKKAEELDTLVQRYK